MKRPRKAAVFGIKLTATAINNKYLDKKRRGPGVDHCNCLCHVSLWYCIQCDQKQNMPYSPFFGIRQSSYFSAKKHIVGRIEINTAIVSQSLDIRTMLKHNNKILLDVLFVATFRIWKITIFNMCNFSEFNYQVWWNILHFWNIADMPSKPSLDKLCWQWAETTEPEQVTTEHIRTAYRLSLPICKLAVCKRQCKGNPYCINCIGKFISAVSV